MQEIKEINASLQLIVRKGWCLSRRNDWGSQSLGNWHTSPERCLLFNPNIKSNRPPPNMNNNNNKKDITD